MKALSLLLLAFGYLFSQAHILVFHRFGDDRYPTANTSKKQLIQQFEYLKKHHYKVVRLSDIIQKIKQKQTIPNNWVALSIDDGYKSFYQNGLQIFKKYNYPFALFVYVKAVNSHYGDFMRWKEIKECAKYGEIGIHSFAHPHLTSLNNTQILKDTTKAINIFYKNMGFKSLYYAYPYGEYDIRVKNIIKPYFKAIFNQNIGTVHKNSDIYDIDRIAIVGRSKIEEKLKYSHFDVKWIEPTIYPQNKFLKKIVAKVNTNKKYVKLFVSGYGWRDVEVKNNMVEYDFNKKLVYKRTRIIIGENPYKISTKLLIK